MAAVNLGVNEALREIIENLMRIRSPTFDDVNRVKMRVAAEYKLGKVPSNAE